MKVCEEKCNFTDYDNENNKAICSYEVKKGIKKFLHKRNILSILSTKMYRNYSNPIFLKILNNKTYSSYQLLQKYQN